MKIQLQVHLDDRIYEIMYVVPPNFLKPYYLPFNRCISVKL